MCYVLDCSRAKLYAWPDTALSEPQLNELERLTQRRKQGEPIAYIMGHREFWSLDIDVCPDVLVPRPDTERLVELALDALTGNLEGPVLDAGTGSGAIAIAIAHEWQSRSDTKQALSIMASDLSMAALSLAQRNAAKYNLSNIGFVRSNWLDVFADNSLGMIISNPPYLAENDTHLDNATLKYEPQSALVAGEDGLADIRTLINDATRVGKPRAPVFIEHGASQANAVSDLMIAAHYTNVNTYNDLAGLNRVTGGLCPEN